MNNQNAVPPNPLTTPVLPIFLRFPDNPAREIWPGCPLNYWRLRRFISPGPWNGRRAPVRAYSLRRVGAGAGTVLIERQDLLDWRNEIFRQDNPDYTPAGVPPVPLPPFLSLPSRRTRRCPYTGLGRTVMHGLTSARQPYGPTGIIVARYRIPGLATERLAIDTDSLLRHLRSLPPPHYKIADPGYPSSPGPEL